MKTWDVRHAGRDDADVAKHFKKGGLETFCALGFHLNELKNRFERLGL